MTFVRVTIIVVDAVYLSECGHSCSVDQSDSSDDVEYSNRLHRWSRAVAAIIPKS